MTLLPSVCAHESDAWAEFPCPARESPGIGEQSRGSNLSNVGLKGFERRLEHAVEGVFSRVFKSGVRPIEIGRKLTREMDDHRTVDVRGRTVSPNSFTIAISPDDHDAFVDIADSLARELCDAAREHARDEAYTFLGPVEVELVVDDNQRTGTCSRESRFREGPGGAGAAVRSVPEFAPGRSGSSAGVAHASVFQRPSETGCRRRVVRRSGRRARRGRGTRA